MSAQYPFPRAPASSSHAASSTSSLPIPGEMRTPRFLAAAKEQLRRPSVQSRISTARSLLHATKEYIASTDYKTAYSDVSERLKSAVSSAREYAGSLSREEGVGVEAVGGWVVRKRQTWDEWARERRRRRQEEQRGTERVWLFPGFAIRHPLAASAAPGARWGHNRHQTKETILEGAFDLELKVSGYCTSLRPPEQASRAQRAFMRLARSFSSLPRLPASSGSGSGNGSETDAASLRSFTGGTPPSHSGQNTPLMSPLLRAVITEEPAEGDVDLIDLNSSLSGTSTPRELKLDANGYFTSNSLPGGWDDLSQGSLPSPSSEPLELDLPTPVAPQPPPSSRSVQEGKQLLAAGPAISLSAATPSPPPLPPRHPPVPPKPAALHSGAVPRSQSVPTPTPATPTPATPRPHAPKQPSPLSSPSLGPTHPPSPRPARKSTVSTLSSLQSSVSLSNTGSTLAQAYADLSPEELRTLHANLDARLQPFWASSLSERTVRLTFTLPPSASAPVSDPSSPGSVLRSLAPPAGEREILLLEKKVSTGANGYFEERIKIPWDVLARGVKEAGGDLARLHEVDVRAEVLPLPPLPSSSTTSTVQPAQPAHPTPISPPEGYSIGPPPRLRVISDIDDTVKHTAVLQGAKVVFNNVFVRHLDELVIPGVGEWYRQMEEWGVGFHYVSNSPYELLPVIKDFFEIAGLPHGSIKLKYYSPSAVFTGLWDSAADRKRGGVLEVLNAFPDAKFILIGDTGEQDMELYVQLARERPGQVVAIFLRDVTPPAWTEGEDVGQEQQRQRRPFHRSLSGLSLASAASLSASLPVGGSPLSSPTLEAYRPRRSSTTPSTPPSPASQPHAPAVQAPTVPSSVSYLSPASATQPPPVAQVKAAETWRARLAAARKAVPDGVLFKLFREPEECEEWRELVGKYGA